jgi:hypothetical protein
VRHKSHSTCVERQRQGRMHVVDAMLKACGGLSDADFDPRKNSQTVLQSIMLVIWHPEIAGIVRRLLVDVMGIGLSYGFLSDKPDWVMIAAVRDLVFDSEEHGQVYRYDLPRLVKALKRALNTGVRDMHLYTLYVMEIMEALARRVSMDAFKQLLQENGIAERVLELASAGPMPGDTCLFVWRRSLQKAIVRACAPDIASCTGCGAASARHACLCTARFCSKACYLSSWRVRGDGRPGHHAECGWKGKRVVE